MSSPIAPTITSVDVSSQTMTINFTQGDLGGGNIVKYVYSLNGSEYADAEQTSSPIIISDLSNGFIYSVRLVVFTDAETLNVSEQSNLYENIIPFTSPNAPTIDSINAGNESLTINFTDGYFGGYDVSGYLFSVDGGDNFYEADISGTPLIIGGLTNGTTYTIILKAVSLAPENNVSVASTSLSAIPFTTPGAPTIDSIIPGNETLTVNFTDASFGGYDVSGYLFSVDGGVNFYEADISGTPLIIGGLTNGTIYNVILKSVSLAPENNVSSESAPLSAIPFTSPDAPTIDSIDEGDGTLTVNFTNGNSNGGYDISGYLVSTNGGTDFFNVSEIATPILLTGLSNGTPYNVILKTVSIAPSDNVSSASNTLQAKPHVAPDAPTIDSITGGNGTLTINFSNGASFGGYDLSGYLVSTNGGSTYFPVSEITTPILLTGLTNGTTYTILLKTVSLASTNNTSVASNIVKSIPYTQISAPIITQIDASNKTLKISYTDGDNGGYAVKNRQYTLDNGNTYTDVPKTVTTKLLDTTVYKVGNASLYNENGINVLPTQYNVTNEGIFNLSQDITIPALDTSKNVIYTSNIFSSPIQTITGQTPTYRNGRYIISTSSQSESAAYPDLYIGYRAFNLYNGTSGTTIGWISETRYTTNTGVYNGSVTTTNINGSSNVLGEWIQIQLPYRLLLKNVVLRTSSASWAPPRMPNSLVLLGSNTGTSWDIVYSQTTNSLTVGTLQQNLTINTSTAYQYFRLIARSTMASSNNEMFHLQQLNYSGDIYPILTSLQIPKFLEFNTNTIYASNLFSSNNQTISGVIPSYRNGTYITSSSSAYDPGMIACFAFNLSTTTIISNNLWHSATNVYNTTTGAYTGSVKTINIVNSSDILGEWIQIQFPYRLLLKSFELLPRQTNPSLYTLRLPYSLVILGSNDGSIWNIIYSQTTPPITYNTTTITSIQISNALNAYQYFRLVARTGGGNNSESHTINIQQLNYKI